LSIFTNPKPKKLKPQNLLINKKQEDKKIRKKDKNKLKTKKLVEILNEKLLKD